jgi:alanine racemase
VALRALAEVNLAAIERNSARLKSILSPGTELCAVVKADGYGHGAGQAAQAAQAGGASWLAVATAGEALALRDFGASGRLLILGAVSSEELPLALAADAELVTWDGGYVPVLAAAARTAGRQVRVHVKLDSGLGRLGTRDLETAMEVANAVMAAAPELALSGAMTHFATADADDLEFVADQIRKFEPFVAQMRALAPGITVHAANSAATLRAPQTHYDMVRTGIAIYGADPMNRDPTDHGLEPALSLRSYVAAVKALKPGESLGYGRRFIAEQPTVIATLPIGYADGLPRRLANNLDVLIGGRRYPLRGMVSMDNITVELGPESGVEVGAQATIIGADGSIRQTAEDLAYRLGTINYEVLCFISKRVPRVYHRDRVRL